MKIYLDTKDLIGIVEHSNPIGLNDFNAILREYEYELVLSNVVVQEISAPLIAGSATTNVMKVLNSIEKLPLIYIADGKILRKELEEALFTFHQKREYQPINPYCERYDETCMDRGLPPTHYYLGYGLAETVFNLWTKNPTLFKGHKKYVPHYQHVIEADRELVSRPTLKQNFTKKIGRDLQRHGLNIRKNELALFSDWIYEDPRRCPAARLGYEVYHSIVKNLGDKPKDGDITDFVHINCIPYSDLATLDKRMYEYLRQASLSMNMNYSEKVFTNTEDAIKFITSS